MKESQYEIAAKRTAAPVPDHCELCGCALASSDAMPDTQTMQAAGALLIEQMAEWSREHRNVIGLVLLRLAGDPRTVRQYADALRVNRVTIERAIAAADTFGLSAMLRGNCTRRHIAQSNRRNAERAKTSHGSPRQ